MSHQNALRRIRGRQQAQGALDLNRPTLSLTRDPFNPSKMTGDADRLKLDYPTFYEFDSPKASVFWQNFWLVVLLVAFRSAAALFPEQARMVVAIVATGWLAYRTFRYDIKKVSTYAVPLVFAAVVLTPSAVWSYGLFLAALLVAARFADSFANHHAQHGLAFHQVDETARKRLLKVWKKVSLRERFQRACDGNPEPQDDLEAREFPVRLVYDRALFTLPAAAFFSACVFAATAKMVGAPTVVSTFLGLLSAVVVVALYAWATTGENPFKKGEGSFEEARAVWYGYNYHRAQAPGVWESPEGDCDTRHAKLAAAHRVLAVAVLLAASFFPIPLLAVAPSAWNDAVLPAHPPLGDSALSAEDRRVMESLEVREQFAYVRSRIDELEAERDREALAAASFHHQPEGWLWYLPELVLKTGPRTVLWGLLSFVLCIVIPPAFFFLFLFALTRRRLAHHYRTTFPADAPYHSHSSLVSTSVARIRDSFPKDPESPKNPADERPLWVGLNLEQEYPVLLDRSLLTLHAHFMGSTGSGKTSITAALVAQLADRDTDDSIVIIDLKGDNALFQEARKSAKRSGRQFRWYTNESGERTFAFNPMTQRHVAGLTPLEKTEYFMKPLGLEYPEGYGSSFFMSQNRDALLKLLKHRPETETLRELAALFLQPGQLFKDEEFKRSAHLRAAVSALAEIDSLNISTKPPVALPLRGKKSKKKDSDELDRPSDPLTAEERADYLKHAIEMQDASDPEAQKQVIYFRLRATKGGMSIREIGKFALHSLLRGAADLPKARRRRVWLFIDEFQEIVSRDIQLFFKQAREMKIAAILANQSLAQLEEAGPAVIPELIDNTNTQLVFSANEPGHRKMLSESSGDTIYHMATFENFPDGSTSVRETVGPRLNTNDLIEVSANPELCLAHFKQNMGFTSFDGMPFKIRTEFHISKREFEKRERAGLPETEPGTFTSPFEPVKELTPQETDDAMDTLKKRAEERSSNE